MSIKESLLAITNEVLTDVQKEAEALILAAENQAKETLKAAKQQADNSYQAILNQATIKSEAEKRKIASVTEVEIRNRLLQAKEDLVDDAFQKALMKLKDFTTTDKYHDFLLRLIEENAKQIDRKNLIVQVNAKDKAWLTQAILNRLSKKLKYQLKLSDQTEDFIGGCKTQTVDGKIIIDSTIENRLGELKAILRVEVAKALFGKEA
jgi:V/A-type H+-transporting ATPase subunit E